MIVKITRRLREKQELSLVRRVTAGAEDPTGRFTPAS